jgi:hypothetical protein
MRPYRCLRDNQYPTHTFEYAFVDQFVLHMLLKSRAASSGVIDCAGNHKAVLGSVVSDASGMA